MKKVLGIISYFDENPDNFKVRGSFYAVRKNYIDSLINQHHDSDILIVIIPYISKSIDRYVDLCDGLLCIGGLDIDPRLYGAEIMFDNVSICKERFRFEIPFISKFLKTGKSFLGICAGMQSLNVALGGTLFQDISSEIPNSLSHSQSHEYSKSFHDIEIEKDSKLFSIISENNISVNSIHHQAIRNLGMGLIISATSLDGIIEAVELENYKFCIGVQWHPEYHSCASDSLLFDAFLNSI